MKERDEILKEKFNDKIIFEEEITNLKKKVETDKKKLEILTKELNISKKIYITDGYQERMEEASKFILEISKELLNPQLFQNKNLLGIESIINATLTNLKDKENNINNFFEEIEGFQKNDKNAENLIKEIYDQIKLKNKTQKYKEGREAMLSLEEEKNLKYLQKNYRYRVRGPIRYPPPYILEKKKEIEDKDKENKVNEEEMLYYYEK